MLIVFDAEIPLLPFVWDNLTLLSRAVLSVRIQRLNDMNTLRCRLISGPLYSVPQNFALCDHTKGFLNLVK